MVVVDDAAFWRNYIDANYEHKNDKKWCCCHHLHTGKIGDQFYPIINDSDVVDPLTQRLQQPLGEIFILLLLLFLMKWHDAQMCAFVTFLHYFFYHDKNLDLAWVYWDYFQRLRLFTLAVNVADKFWIDLFFFRN